MYRCPSTSDSLCYRGIWSVELSTCQARCSSGASFPLALPPPQSHSNKRLPVTPYLQDWSGTLIIVDLFYDVLHNTRLR